MDCAELLAREDEFKKLNKQLEKKTESLMKQIEIQMQKQDIFSDFPSLAQSRVHTGSAKKHSCSSSNSNTASENSTPVKSRNVSRKPIGLKRVENAATTEFGGQIDDLGEKNLKNSSDGLKTDRRIICACCPASREERISGDLEFLYAFVTINVQQKILPQSFAKDRPTVESVCKFLANKLKLLQEQVDKLQATLNKKASQCEAHLTHQADLEAERMTLMNTCNNLRASAADANARVRVVQGKLDEKDRLYKEQRSEADRLAVEVKKLRGRSAGVEAKSALQEDTVHTLRHQLEAARRAEKELRESSRSLAADHQQEAKRLHTQLAQLQACSRKQAALIVNLRKQRTLLTARNAVEAIEKEYNKFLEMF